MAQWLTNLTSIMRLQVRSLALISGLMFWFFCELGHKSQTLLRSRHCCGCGGSYRSDSTLSLGTFISRGPKKIKDKKKKKKEKRLSFFSIFECRLTLVTFLTNGVNRTDSVAGSQEVLQLSLDL